MVTKWFLLLFVVGSVAAHGRSACKAPETLANGEAFMTCRWFGQGRKWNAKLKKTKAFLSDSTEAKALSYPVHFMSSELPILQGKHIHLSFKARKASVSSKNLYIAYESVSDGKKETIYFRPARIDGYLVSFKARGFGKYQLVAFSNK